MSSGIAFTPDSARRIANATRGWEQQQGAPEPTTYEADSSYGRMMLVRTDPSFPTNYSGDMAAGAAIIEKLADGTVKVITTVWLKDLNNAALKPSTIYQARLSGTYTQEVIVNGISTFKTFALYLVQLPVFSDESHFRPFWFFLSNSNIFVMQNSTYMWLYGNVVIQWQGVMSNYSIGSVRLFVRTTRNTITYNNVKYTLAEWYTDEIIVGPVKIYGIDAYKPDGSIYNIVVKNPWNYALQMGIGNFNSAGGYFVCQYKISPEQKPYTYTLCADQLVCISKIAEWQTTAGIGSGIGSGISGV
jgi:hypothetical protein